MNKQITSIIIILALSINIFACTSQIVSASNKNTNETMQDIQIESTLAEGIKKVLEKDVIKSLLGNKTIHETIEDALNNGVLKNLENDIKKNLSDISTSIDNFKTDNSTYNWLSKLITAMLKKALNNRSIKQSDIDQINSTISFFGVKKISVDLTKDNYTDEDAEKIALDLLPILEKILNPTLLKFVGINLQDPNFWNNIFNNISF